MKLFTHDWKRYLGKRLKKELIKIREKNLNKTVGTGSLPIRNRQNYGERDQIIFLFF